MLKEDLSEGDFLVLRDGSLWVVKGCYQPPGGVIALPRYIHGVKIKTYGGGLNVVMRYYRHYLRWVEEIGREVPVVPLEDVRKFLRKWEHTCCAEGEARTFLRRCCELIKLLESRCGCRCVPTGSILGGYWTPESDIDLICDDCQGLYECLTSLRSLKYLQAIPPCKAEEEVLSVVEQIEPKLHARMIRGKLLQGVFKGVKYTIKVLNCSRYRVIHGPCEKLYRGELLLRVENADYRTPTIYPAAVVRGLHTKALREVLMYTFRTRFAELSEDTLVYYAGPLCFREGRLLINLDAGTDVHIILNHRT